VASPVRRPSSPEHQPTQVICSGPVPLGEHMAVDAQSRAGVRMPEPASNRPHVYAGAYQLGGREVTQVVEPRLDAQLAGQAPVGSSEPVRQAGL
jgi:hypothetical protein